MKSITTYPKSFNDTNKWADYIEILCLLSPDADLTVDDIYDRVSGDKSADEESEIFEDYILENSINITEMDKGSDSAPKTDFKYEKIRDYFKLLDARQAQFNSSYPFVISNQNRITRIDQFSNQHYTYIYLLFSANLDYFSKFLYQLSHNFEEISLDVFRKLLPPTSQVHYFGSGGKRGGLFQPNKLYDRIKILGAQLGLHLSSRCTEDSIGRNNSGDGGLDLVGWYDFKEKNVGMITYFAQCACGKDWFDKQFESHPLSWEGKLQLVNRPINVLFTPSSFRKLDGHWLNDGKIIDAIIIDRLRIVRHITLQESEQNVLRNNDMIEQIFKERLKYDE